MKKAALAITLSIVSVSCLQSTAWSTSSLLMQMPAILAASQKGGSLVINDNVTVIGENNSANIVSSNIGSTGQAELTLSGELAASAQAGSVLYILPGADNRFPFGVAGKVVSGSSNANGTKTVVLQEASYADVVKEASFDMDNITLDASNFVGVIAPTAVEAASPMPMSFAKSASDGSVYSFRDGAVVVRRAADRGRAMYSAVEGGTIDAGTVSLNMKVGLSGMGVDVSNLTSVNGFLGFIISGSLDDIKVTNNHKFSVFPPQLEADLRVESDMKFDVKFQG